MITLFSNFYKDEDIAEYVEMIDEQDRELRRLREYKRIQEELFTAMTSDDEDLCRVIQASDMKAMGMTDTEICTVLNIKRDKLNYLRKKIELKEKDSV